MAAISRSERQSEFARLIAQGEELQQRALALLEAPVDRTVLLAFLRDLKAHGREVATYRAIFGRKQRP